MKIILYDSECLLCNKLIQFIIKKDKRGKFFFASLQGNRAQELSEKFGFSTQDINTMYYIENDTLFSESNAALMILKNLQADLKCRLLYYSGYILPKFIRDFLYKIVAENRYHIMGKSTQCMIPSREIKNRILD